MAALQIAGGDAYPFSTQVLDIATGRLWPTVLSDTANAVLWGTMLHFAVVFPRPWKIIARRPRLIALVYVLPFIFYLGTLVTHLPAANPLQRLGFEASVSPPAANVYPLLIVAALVTSYVIAGDRLDRRRMRWQLYTFGFGTACYLGLGRLPEWLTGQPLVSWDALTLSFLPCPVALGVAVLRYRLFDIQVILRRSLLYGLLSGILLAGYLSLFTALRLVTGARPDPAALLSVAVGVLTIVPLATRLRRVASRWVFGDRDEPYEVLRQLGATLQSAASSQAVLDHVVLTLSRTLRLSYAAVEVAGLDRLASRWGTPTGTAVTIPLVYHSEHNGQLILDPGPLREPFGLSDQRLLEGIAQQVGVVAHNLLLAQRLQRSLERTLTALEEERRRLRRDIHDGLGPTLASASMRLELARSLMREDPGTADGIFDGLVQTHHQALRDIRRLVDGLRPPVLDQLGLLPALRDRAARLSGSVVISVEADADPEPLPAAAEVAVYHIVSEALTNVVRHASASVCTVRLCRDDRALRVEIRDDGKGLPPGYQPGVGLQSIRERSAELGGSAEIRDAPEGGTVVSATLPLLASVHSRLVPPGTRQL
jgi:two-component system, NarL family, sensor kinase